DYIRSDRQHNTIHAVSQDGLRFDQKQVILTNADYPDFCSCHVRDPKVNPTADGYEMVLGAHAHWTTKAAPCFTAAVIYNNGSWMPCCVPRQKWAICGMRICFILIRLMCCCCPGIERQVTTMKMFTTTLFYPPWR
ncbi:MAG: hypothetical protein ACLSFJ_03360, partial [Holdemania filiformis]